MEEERLSSIIESILFAADQPVTIDRLREVLAECCPSAEEIETHIAGIKERYERSYHGVELRKALNGYQLISKKDNAEFVRKFLMTKPLRLGRSTMETLAIIAYRQPITRAEMDQVRGMDNSHLLRTLIERGLVKMAGKADAPGRPVQYATTPRFLEIMGLNNLSDLPPLSELTQLKGDTEDPMRALEEGLEKFAEGSLCAEDITGSHLQKGLEEIEAMIESAQKGTQEVYASQLHSDVAEENLSATTNAQDFLKELQRRSPPKGTALLQETTFPEGTALL